MNDRIRIRVGGDFGEEQPGFRNGRGTADEIYVMRQMVAKRLNVQGSRPGESFLTQRDGDGDATVDGSTRSRSESG